jgi:hypothetical protein
LDFSSYYLLSVKSNKCTREEGSMGVIENGRAAYRAAGDGVGTWQLTGFSVEWFFDPCDLTGSVWRGKDLRNGHDEVKKCIC